MWFKNLQVFELAEAVPYAPDDLENTLADHAFIPCPKSGLQSCGFYPPMQEEDASLVHAGNGFMLLCLKIQDKVIPSSLLREELQRKVHQIETEDDRKVGGKERMRIREAIHSDLVLRAFCKSSYLYGLIDTKNQLLIVNCASANKAEFFINALRKALGSLKTQLPDITSPGFILTHWLKAKAAPGFVLEDYCELRDSDDLGTVRIKHQDIASDPFQTLIDDGSIVKQVRLNWEDQVSFIMKDDFSFSGIRYLNGVLEQRDDAHTETAADRFDADFVIMSSTLRQLLETLFITFQPSSVASHGKNVTSS